MEFIRKNFFDTTTSAVVNSNTATAANLLTRDIRYQYVSDGFNNDLTTATLRINFSATQSVSRIALLGMNLRSFTIYYNGVTANTFALTSTGVTTVSDFTTNSQSAMYLMATPVNCTSVSIDMKTTQVANQNKAVGYLVLSNLLTDFDGRITSAQGYRSLFEPKQVLHELSDGSFRSQVVDRKFSAQLGFDYLETATVDEIKTVFDLHDDFCFAAFPTTTGWDEVFFPCIWHGAFEFFEVSDNAIAAGFSGKIRLLETRPG